MIHRVIMQQAIDGIEQVQVVGLMAAAQEGLCDSFTRYRNVSYGDIKQFVDNAALGIGQPVVNPRQIGDGLGHVGMPLL